MERGVRVEEILRFRAVFNDLLEEELSQKSLDEVCMELGTVPRVVLKWRKQTKNIKLGSLLKIADCFNCSIDYLCGRTDVPLDFIPKPCPPFSLQIQRILKQLNKTSYQLFKETRIKSSQYHYWRHGYEPLLSSLEILANYLKISIDQLVGRDSL